MVQVAVSDKVSDIIDERRDWGQFKKVQAEALLYVDDSSAAIRLLKKLNQIGGLAKDVTIATRYGMLFIGNPAAVTSRLKGIPRVEKKTPRWMLVKMISTRLAKIYGKKKTDDGYGTHLNLKSAVLTRKKVNPMDIKEWTDYHYPDDCRKAAFELVKILNRRNVDHTVINEAWDQLTVQNVMTE